jgi:hypothetical protein
MRQCPSTRVCFLWVIASFSFPQIKRATTQPVLFCLCVPPFTLLSSSHNIQQWLPGVGMNTISIMSCGISNLQISKPIFQWKARVTSDRCVKLEATHPSKRCRGLGVHGVFCVMQVYEGWNNSGRHFAPIKSTSTTSRTSSSTTWSGSCRRNWLLQIHHLAQETTNVVNVQPALVDATRRSPPPRNIGPLHLHLHLHLTWVLLHAVATLRRLYALRAVLVQLD